MATRSTIARLIDGEVQSIYCHYDGYPSGLGVTLREHYTSEDKIEDLFHLGDLSYLTDDIGVKHDFNAPTKGYTLAYGRDRGEVGVGSLIHDTQADWVDYRREQWCEYGYLWTGYEWETYAIG
jgi:hypothetical protein